MRTPLATALLALCLMAIPVTADEGQDSSRPQEDPQSHAALAFAQQTCIVFSPASKPPVMVDPAGCLPF